MSGYGIEDEVDPDLLDLGSQGGESMAFGGENDDPFSSSDGPSSTSAATLGFRSPQSAARRGNMRQVSGGAAERQSLAFELASAMETEDSSTSDLLNELGIEEPEGEHFGANEYEESELDYGGHDGGQAVDETVKGGSASPARRPTLSDHSALLSDPTSTPMSRQRSSRSSAVSQETLAGTSPAGPSTAHTSPPPGGAAALEDDVLEQADWDFSEDTRSLRAATEYTDAFLALLRQSSEPIGVPSSPLVPLRPLQDRGSGGGGDSGEQAVEKMIGDVVKTMHEQARNREAQVRELKEMEMAFAKTNPRVLAGLDALPLPSPVPNSSAAVTTGPLLVNGDADNEFDLRTPLADRFAESSSGEDISDVLDPSYSPTTPTSPTVNRIVGRPRTHSLGQSDTMLSLADLRTLTASLVFSLSAINEQTQIGRASNAEAGRRLKNVRTLLGNWKAEVEGVESSKRWVQEWETDNATSEKGKYASQVNAAATDVRRLLEESEQRAKLLLSM